jgi:hypothetical protein
MLNYIDLSGTTETSLELDVFPLNGNPTERGEPDSATADPRKHYRLIADGCRR